jgi:hypothetical protein
VVTFLVVMVMIPLLLSSVLRSKQSETDICYSELNTAIIFCSIYSVIQTITCETLATDKTEKQLISQ